MHNVYRVEWHDAKVSQALLDSIIVNREFMIRLQRKKFAPSREEFYEIEFILRYQFTRAQDGKNAVWESAMEMRMTTAAKAAREWIERLVTRKHKTYNCFRDFQVGNFPLQWDKMTSGKTSRLQAHLPPSTRKHWRWVYNFCTPRFHIESSLGLNNVYWINMKQNISLHQIRKYLHFSGFDFSLSGAAVSFSSGFLFG